jgi:formyl-CoA transferase
MLGTPFKLNATPTSVRRAPPTLGQHADEILREELGLDDDAIETLRRDKVI